MRLAEERLMALEPAVVWDAVLDTGVWLRCVPSLDSLTGTPDAGYDAVVVQRIGPLKARFSGRITLSDVVWGESLTVTGGGQGGIAGFARGVAVVRLEPAAGGTRLVYELQAEVGGRLGQLGGRIVESVAKSLADQFFARFERAAAGLPAESVPRKGWLGRLIG